MTICFATNNHHKLQEVMAVLGGSIELQTLAEIGCEVELPETQPTIEGNAIQKASYVWDNYAVPCFADDTGLEVPSLNLEPGVYSARYAGPQRNADDNMNLLLQRLQDKSRVARFRTVIALRMPQGQWLFEGVVEGTILTGKRGTGGFGYDPLFVPDGFAKTLAEMTMDEKNSISHRAIAVQKLAAFLRRGNFSLPSNL